MFSCFSAAVDSVPITFGHVEFNFGRDWDIIFSGWNPHSDDTLAQHLLWEDL